MSVTPDTPTVITPAGAIPAPRPAADDADRTPTVPPAAPQAPAVVELCRCGHGRDAHEHYRPGTDCGACGADCRSFRAGDTRPVRRRVRLASRLLRP
ncbi:MULTISPECIES: hypothetical protein [Pseudonocardia]|uniref:Uncharacterized protein n=2 Tax=Pseudonocardia TaxID=1847 RepID=A0A1Y2N9A7_PSEAH|nr:MULTISPECIES: hypothetical protein [Pseudonocardia]OSY43637.1 hypothetical protein BG845_00583 [Pseudonocardia autotrophica]TDN73373.1 hypothetical protein C8E95_2466 [Pseudonocardia autotrophica]BBG04111.1 hypothetical protein Pdca_53200 [Pseudonocardia autotrophica]GEC25442.1 hypothetical protein PSA01_24710 [Pseudonocardia saturnea]